MKKKLILAGAAMLLTAAAITGFSAHSKTDASDLLNANIEALARGEGEMVCTGPKEGTLVISCKSTNDHPCKDNQGCN